MISHKAKLFSLLLVIGAALTFKLTPVIKERNRAEAIRIGEIKREAYKQQIYREREFRDAHIKFSEISAKITKRGVDYNIVTVSGTVHNIARQVLEAPIQAEIETVDIKSQRLRLHPDEKKQFRIDLLDEGELRTSFPKSIIKVYLDDERQL